MNCWASTIIHLRYCIEPRTDKLSNLIRSSLIIWLLYKTIKENVAFIYLYYSIPFTDSKYVQSLKNVLFVSEPLEFIPSNRGKGHLLMCNGYSFVNVYNNTRWHCSKRLAGCKVRLSTNMERKLIGISGQHNHEPPSFYRASDGKLYRR